MELPPGPRAPAAWQTLGWTVRPAAFLRRVHERFGEPVTLRTYWTDEPMVLFSQPDLGAGDLPSGSCHRAGRSELGVHAPLRRRALDPRARRRRAPARAAAHPDALPRRAHARVRADGGRARRARAGGLVRPGHGARAHARPDARDDPADRVRGARGGGAGASAAGRSRHARQRALDAAHARDVAGAARPRPAQPVGALPDRGRALRRAAARPRRAPARRARGRVDARAAARAARRARQAAERPPPARPARRAVGGGPRHHLRARSPGRSSGSRAIPASRRACATATRRIWPRS